MILELKGLLYSFLREFLRFRGLRVELRVIPKEGARGKAG